MQLSFIAMNSSENPFAVKPGFGGIVVKFSDHRMYLREWHAHESLEINLVVRGSGSVLLEDRRYPLLPGHLIWLWPGQRHIPADWSSDMLLWIVEWQPEFGARLRRSRGRASDAFKPLDGARYCCRRLDSRALQQMQGVLSGVASMERADAFHRGLEFALLALWDSFLSASTVAGETYLHPKLVPVINALNNPQGDQTLNQLAELVHVSPYYLSVLFRKQTGMGIAEYRNRIRMNRFFTLFRAQPGIRLLELALASGFGSYAQFYRVFTESTGHPPNAWLKSTRE